MVAVMWPYHDVVAFWSGWYHTCFRWSTVECCSVFSVWAPKVWCGSWNYLGFSKCTESVHPHNWWLRLHTWTAVLLACYKYIAKNWQPTFTLVPYFVQLMLCIVLSFRLRIRSDGDTLVTNMETWSTMSSEINRRRVTLRSCDGPMAGACHS